MTPDLDFKYQIVSDNGQVIAETHTKWTAECLLAGMKADPSPTGRHEFTIRMKKRKIWTCKIGEMDIVPNGADAGMREAVASAYQEVTGRLPDFIFSGWGGELTYAEREIAEREGGAYNSEDQPRAPMVDSEGRPKAPAGIGSEP